MKIQALDRLLASLPEYVYDAKIEFETALKSFNLKVIVLDDDPTGVQTVHDIPVYTSYEQADIDNGFAEDGMFFILTNSRGFTSAAVESMNRTIAERILKASVDTDKDFVIISRSDSTLRGHYPLETQTLRDTIERNSDLKFDGEIICPFFIEGGRYTVNNIHYVLYGNDLIPAAQTEFAKDKTFSYNSSDLREWVEEKTNRKYTKESVRAVSIEHLRTKGSETVLTQLLEMKDFDKVVVNAVSYDDLWIFLTAYIRATELGKRFIFRTAAAIPKLLGGVTDTELLTREQLISGSTNGGLTVIGSHVEKTSEQLYQLLEHCDVQPIEFDQHLVLKQAKFEAEQHRVQQLINDYISKGKDVVVYTRRDRLDMNTGNAEDELRLTNSISTAVTGFVKNMSLQPSYIIAKGGITSSEIGTEGLNVTRAMVAGQVLPGIPVWRLGAESKFPGMAYIIFPGNVGNNDALQKIVQMLKDKR
ncbi:MAG: hydroxyacid dehydrogenase [Oscillospiraceae bacterium]|nr:hydroxyacid dehydrogenase [Oscillospiraceae bacterium]